jgi:hypothetical protein
MKCATQNPCHMSTKQDSNCCTWGANERSFHIAHTLWRREQQVASTSLPNRIRIRERLAKINGPGANLRVSTTHLVHNLHHRHGRSLVPFNPLLVCANSRPAATLSSSPGFHTAHYFPCNHPGSTLDFAHRQALSLVTAPTTCAHFVCTVCNKPRTSLAHAHAAKTKAIHDDTLNHNPHNGRRTTFLARCIRRRCTRPSATSSCF